MREYLFPSTPLLGIYTNIPFYRYDIFAINLASVMPDFVYQPSPPSHINRALANAVKIAAPLGTFIGQLLFGWLADRTGRKRMCKSIYA